MNNLNAIITIAYRDFTKLLRDRGRMVATFIFPFIFIGVLGNSLQSNLGDKAGYNFLLFTFIGVIGQTLFQSTASGVISLIMDRENDFSQELFVSPVSRYAIILGKIVGESVVSFFQVVGITIFGFIIGIPLDLGRLLSLLPFAILACLLGGAFGILVLSKLSDQRSAQQVFPFIILPQYFLSGVFNPVKDLPIYLLILSRISPMTYAVDLMRSVYYQGLPEYSKVVLFNLPLNILIGSTLFIVFLTLGTYFFMQNERNR